MSESCPVYLVFVTVFISCLLFSHQFKCCGTIGFCDEDEMDYVINYSLLDVMKITLKSPITFFPLTNGYFILLTF